MYNLILFLIIFLIITFFFISLNFIFKINTENYGVFCGRYNLHRRGAKKNCIKDSNCKWKKFNDPTSGKTVSWCSDNPSNATIATKISDFKSNLEEQLMPTWMYELSSGSWITPTPNTLIGDWSTTNVKNSTIMTISFWLKITATNPLHRNIFHVSGTNNDMINIGDRTPAFFISQGSTKLTVRNDSTTTKNNGIAQSTYTPALNIPIFVTIVYNTTTLSLYVNSTLSDTVTYSPGIEEASSNAKFYISDPWYPATGGYQIKDLGIYNSALSSNNVRLIYNAAIYNS